LQPSEELRPARGSEAAERAALHVALHFPLPSGFLHNSSSHGNRSASSERALRRPFHAGPSVGAGRGRVGARRASPGCLPRVLALDASPASTQSWGSFLMTDIADDFVK